MTARPIIAGLGLLLLSTTLLFLFFVILSGVRDHTPLNQTYFLEADTSGITGARDTSRWTYFYVCNERNVDCWGAWPAPAFGWAWHANPDNVPDGLSGSHGGDTTSHSYFYMWRFSWVFYMIALFFVALAWFSSFLACFGRLGSAVAALLSSIGLLFLTIAVSLMTATFVQARDAFRAAGRDAHLGPYAFGFSWASWAALLIATVLFCIGIRGRDEGRGWGRRSKSTRSRRSHDLGNHRVKDDYS
ncbi:hypothetical protein SODALDRAFT_322271 [Sodiomyces alkalinus F11]|uniref:SUR7-domain-containing protein n=1 Tax=Sodiomyces alkalinus (strain CBS 110278 / VKM F-3762 / F11) TaxID=1314773 RepID=A0A3N2Q2R5_SODAK|nr:hypothetical protein SODALDRAFT_322271 [Sodiomyces alkalinus F11]ROT41059.1 hypothetical protein SODALDRAFT_322271 [Sodiomyces alkalinus F11]